MTDHERPPYSVGGLGIPAWTDPERPCCAEPGGAFCRDTTGYHTCMTDPERPPVDPLREAAQTISFLLSVVASGERLSPDEVESARGVARALASPAARPWHESALHAKYGWHADCPECASPAAPRPEGLEAFYHATRQGEPCVHPGDETTPECEVFAAEYAAAAPRPEGLPTVAELSVALRALDPDDWPQYGYEKSAAAILARLSATSD